MTFLSILLPDLDCARIHMDTALLSQSWHVYTQVDDANGFKMPGNNVIEHYSNIT